VQFRPQVGFDEVFERGAEVVGGEGYRTEKYRDKFKGKGFDAGGFDRC